MNNHKCINVILIILCSLNLPGCVKFAKKSSLSNKRYKLEKDTGPARKDKIPDLSKIPDAQPKYEPRSKIGNPKSYKVFNKTYKVLTSSKGYKARGTASWYGKKFHGYHTSSGEVYDMYAMSAAHKTLPLPTYVKVTNLKNGRSVIVKINDRGPFHDDRIIDLSYAAANKLGILPTGTASVEIQALEPDSKKSSIFLQIGSYEQEHNARILAEKIQSIAANKHKISVQFSKSTNGKRFHVHVGPIADETYIPELTNALLINNLPTPSRIHRQ